MKENIRQLVGKYLDPAEAERAHPRLDRSKPMPKADFADIVGSYTFKPADWVKCQLVTTGSGMCLQSHGIGYIMLRKDGSEGYIGGNCARDHFQADEAFAGAVARARRDARTRGLLDRLEPLLRDRENLSERIKDVFAQQQALLSRVKAIRRAFPIGALRRLNDMVKTGNRSISLNFRYVEKDEDKNGKVIEVARYRPHTIATVVSPGSIDLAPIEAIGERLRAAVVACADAETNMDRAEGVLRGWVESLEGVDGCESELEELMLTLESFVRIDNLKSLCWICPNGEDQEKTAQAALSLSGAKNAGESAARRARDQWREEIIASREGREFRVV